MFPQKFFDVHARPSADFGMVFPQWVQNHIYHVETIVERFFRLKPSKERLERMVSDFFGG